MTVRLIGGLREIAPAYDALIVDLWGVVHDGVVPYAGAVDCLARLGDRGARVVLLSNAPRPSPRAVEMLRGMGVADGLYLGVVTSGDAVRDALARRADPWVAALGRRYLFLGKDGDRGLLDGLGYREAAGVEDAEFVLNTGLDAGAETVADYDAVLRRAAARGLGMVCANPDLAVIRGGRREPCAGALAARYAALGGKVRAYGKPHPEVYALCFAALAGVARERILAVGDGLETDIEGARRAGLDSLLVTGGLLAHAWGTPRGAPPDAGRLAAACAEAGVAPTAAVPAFVW